MTWLVKRNGIGTLKDLMREYGKAYNGPNVDAHTAKLLRKVYSVKEKDVVDGMFAELSRLNRS